MILLSVISALSGAAALLFESLWFRQAGLAFGNSVWASSLVLAAFMAGLGLGNGLVARLGTGGRRGLRVYALAELIVGVTGVAIVLLLPGIGAALVPLFRTVIDQPPVLNALRLLTAVIVLLVPSTAMGVTLPLLVGARRSEPVSSSQAAAGEGDRFGVALGTLYGWNTIGAVAGALASDAVLLGWVGVRGTGVCAAALDVVAALLALALDRRRRAAVSDRVETRPRPGARPGAVRRSAAPVSGGAAASRAAVLVAAGLSGFALLALEVVWFRLLVLFVKGHSGAFPVMLATVLAGVALGGLAASVWERSRVPGPGVAVLAAVAGAACLGSYALLPIWLAPFGLQTITTPFAIVRLGAPLMLPVSFVSGVLFTRLGSALRRAGESDEAVTGVLTLANTAGAAVGSLAAGFILLPTLGIERSMVVIAAVYGVVAMVHGRGASRVGLVGAGAVLGLAFLVFPYGMLNERLVPIPVARWADTETSRRVVAVREGLTETVVLFERLVAGQPVSHVMLTNSFSMSTTGYGVRRYQKLYVYWPMAVRPDTRSALLIGYGMGNTAKALTDTAAIQRIDLVDLSRDILRLDEFVYPKASDRPLADPRMHVHLEDGRYFLRTTTQSFDLITGEPPPPGIAGVEHLYSREYFALLRGRLAPGGITTYWLPLADLSARSARAIVRAFCDVFDDCSLWNGAGTNLMLVGTRGVAGPVSDDAFSRQWKVPAVVAEMRRLGFETPEQLGALFIGDAGFLRAFTAGVEPLTDDWPRRIDPAPGSAEAERRMYAELSDVAAARTRFMASPFITRTWPARLRVASAAFFDAQHVIDTHLYGDLIAHDEAIADVHALLTHTSLAAPVQWRAGSNADIQGMIGRAVPTVRSLPLLQYHLGVRLLSDRNYLAAAEAFARAQDAPGVGDNAFVLRVYALAMGERIEEAHSLAAAAFTQALRQQGIDPAAARQASLPPFWEWLRRTFGVDPRQ